MKTLTFVPLLPASSLACNPNHQTLFFTSPFASFCDAFSVCLCVSFVYVFITVNLLLFRVIVAVLWWPAAAL